MVQRYSGHFSKSEKRGIHLKVFLLFREISSGKDCSICFPNRYFHCRISYREGLGMSTCIMGLTTQDPYIQKEHTELYKILKFCVNCENIEQDTAIQKPKNLVTNHKCMNCRTLVRKSIHFFANFEFFEWLYLVQYWPN